MRAKVKQSNIRNRTELSLLDIAQMFNPILQGWINYYGCYTPSALYPLCRYFNMTLIAWAKKKYKSLRGSKIKTVMFLERIIKEQPLLFVH